MLQRYTTRFFEQESNNEVCNCFQEECNMDNKWRGIAHTLDYAFQPIVNVHNGICLGYEALLRNYEQAGFNSIKDIFDAAFNEQVLFGFELALREKSLEKFMCLKNHQKAKLFFNIDNRVILMPDYSTGNTSQMLKRFGVLPSSICFEISERHEFDSYPHVKTILNAYKRQFYKIAIDDFGTGYSGLQLLYHSDPDFIKIDRFFISGIEGDSKKKLFLAKVLSLAHILGIITIAEGVETEKEFFFCKEAGCDYVQGFFIQRPTANLDEICEKYDHITLINVQNKRQKIYDHVLLQDQMEYLEPVCLHNSQTGQLTDMSTVFDNFRTNKNNTFFPVVNGHNEPIGLIRERELKEFVYSRYGKDLLLNKAAGKTLVDFIAKCPIAEINTKVEKILEYFSMDEFSEGVLLTENGIYIGFLSTRSLLKVLNEKNVAIARDQNPLTKLPGNTLINEFIEQALVDQEKKYIIAYFDFDYFKAFNDKYGFRQGDRAILLFSDILKITGTANRFFAGHIGGDDFFAGFIISGDEIFQINSLIEYIINKFANDIISLYDSEDREKGYIISTDREGNIKQFPFMTVSASIINIPAEEINMTTEGLSLAIADLKKSAKHSETGMAFLTLDNKDKLMTGIKKEANRAILTLYR